jgi:hypothetical protein
MIPVKTSLALLSALIIAGTTSIANAQIGSGWSSYSPTMKIHLDDENGLQIYSWTSYKSVGSGSICADYQYTSSTDTHRFRILDNRSNRAEIRLENEYSSGKRQFQGYVKFSSPLDNECLMQIFGSSSGATLTMTRGYSSSGGSIRCTGTGGSVTFGSTTLATSCYGVEKRINVIHYQDHYVRWYVNGTEKCEQTDTESGITNYHKFGCYGTLNTGAVTVYWRAVRHYRM